ncbi:hypothetical protein C2G38_2035006 [Gigaspora rosea]|uniref:Uncharacterized protein n=1 Tax=Gigaspora rosea TaxID=44941 RepID=A0A397VNG0_9GLOM|nr:hypothetical protein C2G38_2035006 [Gigaspora rosea]
MTLFVPVNLDDRDPETQAVFVKDNFFSVGGKIIPGFYEGNKRAKMTVSCSTYLTILNKVEESNKCPLKVSLFGIPQEVQNVVKEDAVVQLSVSDYVSQEVNFNVKVVFPCRSTRFAYVKDNIQPGVSLLFIVGQVEIIKNEFYIYARDINCVDTLFISKKNVIDRSSSHGSSFKNLVRSKLLATHVNFAECSKGVPENGNKPSTHARVEDFDDSVEEFCDNFAKNSKGRANNDVSVMSNDHFSDSESNFEVSTGSDCTNFINSLDNCGHEEGEGVLKSNVSQKRSSREKGKERADRSLHVNLRSRGLNSNADVIKE